MTAHMKNGPSDRRGSDTSRLERLEREMRENLKKRKARARAQAKSDVADAQELLLPDSNGARGQSRSGSDD